MYLVISGEFLDGLLESGEASGELWGETADEGNVVRLLRPTPYSETRQLGYWLRSVTPLTLEMLPEALTAILRPGHLVAALDSNESHFYRVDQEKKLVEQPYEVMQLYADYHSRIAGLLDSSLLRQKKVTIVGLGTGGSLIASELAKTGVGYFNLIDFDRLKVHNLTRHICGLRDLGRLKTLAVRDYLYNTSPVVEVETHEFDITTDIARLEEVLTGSDLIVGATDSEGAKDLLNRIAWKLGISTVYGAAYDMGFGGDVFLATPPQGACYRCFRLATQDMFNNDSDKPELDYGKITAQPALGLDVGFISLIAARTGLTWLLREDPTTRLEAFPSNWVLWGNQVQPGWIFEQPLQSEYVEIKPDELCPVCHSEAFTQAKLGMSAEEARASAEALLENLKLSSS
jgi:molybdopterin/thiamine biosynthesis adenylyltransferase